MSGNLWMFSDMLDDEDIEMQKHDFITLYQGADYYGLGLKVFTRMAREAGSVYKIGKKALIRRTIFDEYLRKVYKKELEKNSSDDSGKELMKRQGTMVTDEDSGRMDIRFGLLDYYGGLHCGECLDVLIDGEWVPMCLRNLWSQRLRPEALYWALGSSMNWRPAISLFLDVTAPIS